MHQYLGKNKYYLFLVIKSIIVWFQSAIQVNLAFFLFCCCEDLDEIERVETAQYDFAVIRTATNNFSDAKLLGRGGFGAVYKVCCSQNLIILAKSNREKKPT